MMYFLIYLLIANVSIAIFLGFAAYRKGALFIFILGGFMVGAFYWLITAVKLYG